MVLVRTIYIDVLFAINFIINYLILFATASLSGVHVKRRRLILGGLIGAAYGVTVFFRSMALLNTLIFKVVLAFLMVIATFGFKSRGKLLRLTLLFCGISFAFGGTVFAIFFLTNGASSLFETRNFVLYIHVPIGTLLLSSVTAYTLFSLIFKRSATSSVREIRSVEVINKNKRAGFQALVDTGNSLRDPLTNAPVVIAEYSAVRDIVPESARVILDHTSKEDFPLTLEKIPFEHRFQLIPYKTMNSSFNLLLAFKPEKILINGNENSGALIALSPEMISDGGAYAALI